MLEQQSHPKPPAYIRKHMLTVEVEVRVVLPGSRPAERCFSAALKPLRALKLQRRSAAERRSCRQGELQRCFQAAAQCSPGCLTGLKD